MKRISIFVALLLIISQNPACADSASDLDMTNKSYKLIGLSEARAQGFNGKGQTIVVIDSGVQIDHPYIKDALVDGFCSSESACGSNFGKSGIAAGSIIKNDRPLEVHGSMVGGIATGRGNADAPGGIAPGANLISVNNFEGQSDGIVRALDWVLSIKDKYKIAAVSASFGAPDGNDRGKPGPCLNDLRISDRIGKLAAAGIAFVAAAGNESFVNNLNFPSCLPDVLAIGATNELGSITSYSNIAEKIAVLAPATIVAANSNNGYFMASGTSSATPVVAGAIAILREVKPDATLIEIKKALATTNRYQHDSIWKNIPVLDIPSAIKALLSGNFSNVKISGDISVADSTNSDLEAALVREKSLRDQLVELTAKLLVAEEAALKAETSLSETKNLTSELISKLETEIKGANQTIAILESASKATTITCTKGKLTKKITAVNPKCPTGYKKKV